MRKESQKTLGIWIKLRQANATASKARTRTGHAINHTPSTHDKHKTESTPRFRRAEVQSRRTGIDHASRREGEGKASRSIHGCCNLSKQVRLLGRAGPQKVTGKREVRLS
jgi:hypothetical protein